MNGVLNAIVGGWQTSGVADVQGRVPADHYSGDGLNHLASGHM